MASRRSQTRITVLAGANGAGKSSVAGQALIQAGTEFFNPDQAAERVRSLNPALSQVEANSLAWREGKRLLECAIAEGLDYAFETTLGGRTMVSLLEQAASNGIEVRVWFVGLSSPELHVARVKARARAGGHDIPEEKIRERYTASVVNLLRLLPHLTELVVYDNSQEADSDTDRGPSPLLVLHLRRGRIIKLCEPTVTPEWAKPIVVTAVKLRGAKK